MFGLSWDQLILILLAALFLLGPERIPTAVKWVMESLRKVRTMAAGAQEELRSQIGPELDELRRQVAELQSLKEFGELRALRELNPKTIIGKNILGEEFSGGVSGFLGLGATNGAGAAGTDAAGNGTAGSTPGTTAAGPGAAASTGAQDAAAGSAGTVTATRPLRTLAAGETPPFDDEGT